MTVTSAKADVNVGRPVFQAAEAVETMTAAAEIAAALGMHRSPEFGGFGGDEHEVRGHDADHLGSSCHPA